MTLDGSGRSGPTIERPFVGLRAFEGTEQILFRGRDDQLADLCARLKQFHFVAVVGSSGCGKSSLVKAGLIPVLKGGFLVHNRDVWRVAEFTPGNGPFQALAEALKKSGPPLPDLEASDGPFEEEGWHAVLKSVVSGIKDDENVLLLVDQFEEIFRYDLDKRSNPRNDEATAFVALLLAASTVHAALYIIVTIRSDFLGRCDAFPGLPEALNRGQYLVPRLDREGRRKAIEEPLRLFGRRIDEDLLDRLLSGEPGDKASNEYEGDDLPVLEHALTRVWGVAGSARTLKMEHLREVGGLREALDQDAEDALREANDRPGDLNLVRRVFQELTSKEDNNAAVRRPRTILQLAAVTGGREGDIRRIIKPFKDRSFLRVGEGLDPRIDISHESLIRRWKTLDRWVKEEGEAAATYRDLRGRRAFLQGLDLDNAERWWNEFNPNAEWARRYAREEGEFGKLEELLNRSLQRRKEFLDAEADERQAEEQRIKRELALAKENAALQVKLANEASARENEARSSARYAEENAALQARLANEASAREDEAKHSARQAEDNAALQAKLANEASARENEARHSARQAEDNAALQAEIARKARASAFYAKAIAGLLLLGLVSFLWVSLLFSKGAKRLRAVEMALATTRGGAGQVVQSVRTLAGILDGTGGNVDVEQDLRRALAKIGGHAVAPFEHRPDYYRPDELRPLGAVRVLRSGQLLAVVGPNASKKVADPRRWYMQVSRQGLASEDDWHRLEGSLYDETTLPEDLSAVTVSADSRWLFVGTRAGKVLALETSGKAKRTIELKLAAPPREGDSVGVIAAGHGGSVAASYQSGYLALWLATDGPSGVVWTEQPVAYKPRSTAVLTAVAIDATAPLMVAGDSRGQLYNWTIPPHPERQEAPALEIPGPWPAGYEPAVVSWVSISAGAKEMVAAHADGALVRYRLKGKANWKSEPPLRDVPLSFGRLSPDGRWLVGAVKEEGSVFLWDLQRGSPPEQVRLLGHEGGVTDCDFSGVELTRSRRQSRYAATVAAACCLSKSIGLT